MDIKNIVNMKYGCMNIYKKVVKGMYTVSRVASDTYRTVWWSLWDYTRCSRTINRHQASTFKIAEYMPLALNLKHELEGRLVNTRDDDYFLRLTFCYAQIVCFRHKKKSVRCVISASNRLCPRYAKSNLEDDVLI